MNPITAEYVYCITYIEFVPTTTLKYVIYYQGNIDKLIIVR